MNAAHLCLVFAAAVLAPAAGLAQEVITAGPEGSPPAAETPKGLEAPADDQSPEAIGRWARGVLAGAPAEGPKASPPASPGCVPPADRHPHGEVWAGIGTGGYREAGAVVSKPVGNCGHVTIAIDKVEMGRPHRPR
jgi:hypothetical protein